MGTYSAWPFLIPRKWFKMGTFLIMISNKPFKHDPVPRFEHSGKTCSFVKASYLIGNRTELLKLFFAMKPGDVGNWIIYLWQYIYMGIYMNKYIKTCTHI